jgi:hypothetical protein
MSANRHKQVRHVVGDRSAIWCAACKQDVQARLTTGQEVYPRHPQFWTQPYWVCDGCGNFVGCHHRHHIATMQTRPLGILATPELKFARRKLHELIDPLWQTKVIGRRALYAEIATRMNWPTYHTAEIKSVAEARQVYRVVLDIRSELATGTLTSRRASPGASHEQAVSSYSLP